MRKTKVLLTVSACLVLSGVLLCGVSVAMGYKGGFGLTRDLKYVELEPASMEKTAVEPFYGIELDADMADIELVAGDGYAVEYEGLPSTPAFEVTADGRLCIKTNGDGNYLMFVGDYGVFDGPFRLNTGRIRIYYPAGAELEDVKIDADMSDISIKGLSCASLNVENGAGDTELSEVKAKTAVINSDMGDTEVRGLDAGTADIESSCGDVELTDFAVTASMDIESDMGDVTLTPRGGVDGYSMDLRTDMGDVTLMGRDCGSAAVASAADGIPIRVYNDCGDIEVK